MEEEMELEEGEAYSYHNNDQYGGCMNPDELDYIDVKLQHVLGHFQKDFEGGVSAENLGAKFGGYGSFLPTYQRSPHSKTSPNFQKKDAQPSPSTWPLEEGRRSSVVTEAALQIQRHAPSTTATTPGSESKQHMKNSTVKEKSMPSLRTIEDENSYESENKKFSHTSDQKTLKVRLKLCSSENLSTQNKAALYSGLGLDSPSSSLEQSPFESEGRSCDPQPIVFDSPTSILQVMTSSPLNGAPLLSPLADQLIFLSQKSVMEHSTTSAPRNIARDKKQKSAEKVAVESGGSGSKKPPSDVCGALRKELDAGSSAYDELISDTMKLPIISNPNNTAVDMTKDSKKPSNCKKEKAYELESELFDPQPKGKKTGSKLLSLEGPSKVVVKKQRPSSRKKKFKGSQSSGTAENSKDSLNLSSSRSKKRLSEDSLRIKNDNADLKLRKVLGRGRDLYSDFFGDIEQEEGNPTEAAEKETEDTPQNLGLVERPVSTFSNGSKDRFKNKMSEKDPMGTNNLNRDFGSASGEKLTDVVPTPVAPVIIEENWVQCDKCHQWRLLPIGRNPKSLPDKWLCIMLDWLPGMNRCSFTEEETKEAVRALHQAPVPDLKDSVHLSLKNDGSTEFSVPLKNNIAVDRKRCVDGGSQIPLKVDADLQLPSKFQDLRSDGQSHKQRPSVCYADESDVKTAKGSKKVKNEEYPDEEQKSSHRSSVKKFGHSSSRGLPTATEGNYRSYDEPDHGLKHGYMDNTPTEQPRDQVSFDSDGLGTSDSGKSASRKRKAKEPQGLQGSLDRVSSPWHQHQSTEVPIKDDEYRKHKKTRESKPEGKESTATEGNGSDDKRSKTKQNMQHDLGNSQSQWESDGTNSQKKGAKASGSLAAISSSSKFRKSDKGKVSLQEMKVSPGESVSSSPMRSSKHDKLLFGRSKGAGKDVSRDAVSLPCSSPRRSLDGEDDGNNENVARPSRKSLEASDRDNRVGSTHKEKVVPSIDISHNRPLKVIVDGSDRAAQHPTKLQDSDQRQDGQNGDVHRSAKSGKVLNGEKRRSSKHGRAADKKVSDPSKDSQEPRDSGEKKRDSIRNGKRRTNSSQDAVLNGAHGEENSKMKGVPGRGKGQTLPPSGAGQEGLKPKIKIDSTLVGAVEGDDATKMSGKIERGAHQNGKRQQNGKHLSSNGTTQEIGTTTPIKRDSLFQLANNTLKEAKDLKHLADRVKISDRTGLYFEAALKFLHAASLLESSYNANLKNSEFVQSTYADTAKLCEFCAYDYEKSKDMASAALAYKCTEVAFLKVVYLSQINVSRDRHELQTVLKMIPPGESPSSASSVDHVNNSALMDKANMAKGINSPQVAGNHIITARNRSNFEQLLNFTQNMNNAMEASRKSRSAFDSAIENSKDSQPKETISSIRRALDYNFQDVEGLLQLVRQATEVITR